MASQLIGERGKKYPRTKNEKNFSAMLKRRDPNESNRKNHFSFNKLFIVYGAEIQSREQNESEQSMNALEIRWLSFDCWSFSGT